MRELKEIGKDKSSDSGELVLGCAKSLKFVFVLYGWTFSRSRMYF